MSWEKFDDNCPGCKPAMLDMDTKQVLPDDHPVMQAALAAWSETTLEERQGWHRFMCQNSRTPADVMATNAVNGRIQAKMKAI